MDAVNQYNINDANYGMAGIYGQAIDAISIQGRTYASAYVDGGEMILLFQIKNLKIVKKKL